MTRRYPPRAATDRGAHRGLDDAMAIVALLQQRDSRGEPFSIELFRSMPVQFREAEEPQERQPTVVKVELNIGDLIRLEEETGPEQEENLATEGRQGFWSRLFGKLWC